jgi:2-dehydro-3-deoxyphosphogluconate aldolase/(4S)-4-hydroxy-2-oxoglutarate aldolase
VVLDACRAAIRGGLNILELTLTTPGALDVMEQLAGDDTAVVGAGTVLSVQDVERVAAAGGRFAMSPVFDAEVVAAAHHHGLLAVPGAATPREILTAHRSGARMVKVFPAAALGGPLFLKAVRGPLPDIPLVPTSGPTADTLADYFAAGASAVGIGGEVFPPGFTLEHVEEASRRVRRAVEAVTS